MTHECYFWNVSGNICSYLGPFWAQAKKKKKNPARKKNYYISGNGNFLPPQNFIILF